MGSLPMPMTPPTFPDPTASSQVQGNPKAAGFLALLEHLKQNPDLFKALSGQQGQQPQSGQQLVNPRIAPIHQAPQAPTLETAPGAKMDPMSNVGSLPQPHEQPGPIGAPSASAQLMSMMQPKAAATYSAIMGVSDFLGKMQQKGDDSKKAEAANAGQALMSALESAKTTGDYGPAQHIFENNEALFNKVYKGWLQKSEDAKKPKKPEKVDPEVQAFEQSLTQYMGKGAASQPGQPQPPSTLRGRSGSQYFIPQAAPQQAIQQQQMSQAMQQQRQAPGQVMLTPAEQVKLQENQVNLQKAQVEYQKTQAEVQKAQVEMQKAQAEAQAAAKHGETAEKINQARLTDLQTQLDIKRAQLENTVLQGKNIKAKGAATDKISSAYKVRFAAIDQAENILNTMKSEKRDFTPSDVRDLQQHLNTAGARNLSSSLSKTFNNAWYLPDAMTKPTVDELLNNLKEYKQNLLTLTPAQSPEGTVDKSDDEVIDDSGDDSTIVVSPEDMK